MTKQEMHNKIVEAIRNCENMTTEELKAVYDEAIEFKKTLPAKERERFGLESGLEMLAMIVLSMEYSNY